MMSRSGVLFLQVERDKEKPSSLTKGKDGHFLIDRRIKRAYNIGERRGI